MATAPAVYTDDTSWRIHGQTAHLTTFDTDQATVYQIRGRHRNEEVRELIPADYAGVMITDRGKLSHGSKNERGAEAFAAFTSVIQTAAKNKGCSIIGALQNLFKPKSQKAPSEAHKPPT